MTVLTLLGIKPHRQFDVRVVAVVSQDLHCPVAVLLVGVVVHVAELHVDEGYEDVRVVQAEVREDPAVVTLQVRLDDVGGGGADREDVHQCDAPHRGACRGASQHQVRLLGNSP